MKSAPRHRMIFVLGMHRSGTSAITRGLQALGVDLGDNLLPPVAQDNDKGYWEDFDFHNLNVEILSQAGQRWDSLLPVNFQAIASDSMADLHARAVALVKQKIQRYPLFAVKDPRLSILLPFWQPIIRELCIDASYIIAFRHPLSVARSIAKENLRGRIPQEKSHLLWLWHQLQSLQQTRGHKRIVIDYDQLMDHPRLQLERTANALDLLLDEPRAWEYQQQFLETRLRHSLFTIKDLENDSGLLPGMLDLYKMLCLLASDKCTVQSLDTLVERLLIELQKLVPLLRLLERQEQELDLLRQEQKGISGSI